MSVFKIPSRDDRTLVIGSTGEGKTQFSVWLLSIAHFDKMPYIIFDYKRDGLLGSIDAKEIGVSEKLPTAPGVYIVHPDPMTDEVATEDLLYRIWARGNTGLYFDEGYMVPNSGANQRGYFNSILTQGRSKHIPAIVLTQRPAWISRFVFSEAQHRAIFYLNDADDVKTVKRFLPRGIDLSNPLPKYHCWWYSSGEREAIPVAPVPHADDLIDRINARLVPKERRRIL